jgi:hypothetical protein
LVFFARKSLQPLLQVGNFSWRSCSRVQGPSLCESAAIASGKSADKKQQYADQAMELLRQAVKAGYTDAAHMTEDTDLDSLRGRDHFKKLLQELVKKAIPKLETKP